MSITPLTGIIERIERSIFESIRKEIVDKGYLPDIIATEDYAITTILAAPDRFVVTGDATAFALGGRTATITSSTGNDLFIPTIVSSVYAIGPNETTIEITATPPSGVADGTFQILRYFDDSVGAALFGTDLAAIKTSKGFAIEVFGVGSSQSKNIKKVPRIVIIENRILPGDIGGNPDRTYVPVGADPFAPDSYDAVVLPSQTVSMQYDLHIISNQVRQSRVMHEIVALSMPKRGYIDAIDQVVDTDKYFVDQYSYRDIPDTSKGIDERIYLYEVRDIFETDCVTVATGIAPISEITVEPHLGEPDETGGTDGTEDVDPDWVVD